MDLVILIPVLNRPHRIVPTIESIAASTPEPHSVLFIASPNYPAELAELDRVGANHIVMPHPPEKGDYARKINAGLHMTTEPVLFTGADDLKFHRRWYSFALPLLRRGKHGVIGTNDMGNRRVIMGRHSTHSLVTRDYAVTHGVIDRPNAIYCEEYWHEYCDDEMVQTAMARRQFYFSRRSVVEHLHPDYKKAPLDDSYRRAQERMRHSRPIFESRKHLWQSIR